MSHHELEAEEPDHGPPEEYQERLPPETVTADFLVNLSSKGAKCLMTTLVRLVASRM